MVMEGCEGKGILAMSWSVVCYICGVCLLFLLCMFGKSSNSYVKGIGLFVKLSDVFRMVIS
jgi:hypothetical protein